MMGTQKNDIGMTFFQECKNISDKKCQGAEATGNYFI